jgi:hypothetical protein
MFKYGHGLYFLSNINVVSDKCLHISGLASFFLWLQHVRSYWAGG